MERTQVHVQVSEKQKEQWEEAQKNSTDYANLSDLVRQSVQRELADTTTQSAIDPQEIAEIQDQLSKLDGIQRTVNSLDDRLREVHDEVRHDPDLHDLITEIHRLLPDESELTEGEIQYRPGHGVFWIDEVASLETGDREAVPLSDMTDSELARTGRIEAFAEILGEDTRTVEKAIRQLQEETYVVQQTDDRAYYKRED